jgi:hypothetical protein
MLVVPAFRQSRRGSFDWQFAIFFVQVPAASQDGSFRDGNARRLRIAVHAL